MRAPGSWESNAGQGRELRIPILTHSPAIQKVRSDTPLSVRRLSESSKRETSSLRCFRNWSRLYSSRTSRNAWRARCSALFNLRGLGRLHVFPGDEVGARNNLLRWLGLTGPLNYDGVRRAVTPWSVYGGLVYFHLLLESLVKAGYVS